jgi:hypothetical protein
MGLRCRDAGKRPGFAEPPLDERGMARRKAQTYGSASVAGYGGRLSARHMRSSSEAVAHAICGRLFGIGPRFPVLPAAARTRRRRQPAPGGDS